MRVHIVQKGDTLWKIAKQYAVGFEEVKRLNAHLANPDYIVPGMEIYLPDTAVKKEVKQAVKEQPKPVKEMPVQEMKPAPAPTPTPAPVQPVQKPLWQGNLYFQPPMPAPQPVPMPMPNWQTHVHVQPTMEQNITAPPQQMMPQVQPQPIFIQQPQPQQQPIFIEQPKMHHMHQMPQMHHIPQMHHMPQMMPIQPCPHCHRMPVEEPIRMQPAIREESSSKKMMCPDNEENLRRYYEEIHQMMCMPQPCCHPHMMPYDAMPMPMPQMNPAPRPWRM